MNDDRRPCPYCARMMGAPSLREHLAANTCGQVPPGVCLPFTHDEAHAISEDDFRKMAERVARARGWLVCHVERGQFKEGRWLTPATPGFPDSWFLRPGQLLVIEFKAERGRTALKLRDLQQTWLETLATVPGAVAMRGRPSTWPTIQQALTSG